MTNHFFKVFLKNSESESFFIGLIFSIKLELKFVELDIVLVSLFMDLNLALKEKVENHKSCN